MLEVGESTGTVVDIPQVAVVDIVVVDTFSFGSALTFNMASTVEVGEIEQKVISVLSVSSESLRPDVVIGGALVEVVNTTGWGGLAGVP